MSAINFDEMDEQVREKLIESGRQAVKRFISDGGISRLHRLHNDNLADMDCTYLEITLQAIDLPYEIIISEHDTKWYWQLFPTLLSWRIKKVNIKVLVLPIRGDIREKKKEIWRRKNLVGIGCIVKEVEEITMRAFVFKRRGNNSSSAIIIMAGEANHSPAATLYHGPRHQSVVNLVKEQLQNAFPPTDPSDIDFVPELKSITESEFRNCLKKGVPQYSSNNVSISVEDVPLSQVKSLTKFVRSYKYEQLLPLIENMDSAGIKLFDLCGVTLADGSMSIMAPPVFELHGDTYIGIEGNTRTYYAYRHGMDSIKAIVVTGVQTSLPGTGIQMNEVSLTIGDLDIKLRMLGFDYEQFRRIEGACHENLSQED